MKSFFGCDVDFGADSDEIILPTLVASLPIVGRDNYLNDLLRQYAETALAGRSKERAAIRLAVEKVLPQLLPHAMASMSNVAKQLAMSTTENRRQPGDRDPAQRSADVALRQQHVDRDGAREEHIDHYQQKLHQSDARTMANRQYSSPVCRLPKPSLEMGKL
jgi:hypothetical protein